MAFIERNGVRIRWEEQGQGTPLLLIMGHRYSSAMWYPMLPALTAQHRVIWFDNRGTGESGMTPRVTVAELAGDALAVMDAAKVERAHVFGVSMGGVIAQELALQQPSRVTSLILGCTGILSADKPRMPAFMRVIYHMPPWLLRALTPKRPNSGYGTAAPADAVARDLAVLEKDAYDKRGVLAQAVALANYCVAKDAVAKLTMPALVLHGDEDAAVRFSWGEELAQTLPDSRFVKFAGAGHNFIVADTAKANGAVLDFLRDVDTR